jgi:hypothetical protein
MSLECTFEEFKRAYKEFDTALPTMNRDELDNSFKCLGLMYLNLTEEMWRSSAAIVWKWASDKYRDRDFELFLEEYRE